MWEINGKYLEIYKPKFEYIEGYIKIRTLQEAKK